MGCEEGGVVGRWWEGEREGTGQIGVNAESGAKASVVDRAAAGEEEAVGEASGWAHGRMGEASVADDWPADWGAGEKEAKEGGRVVEEKAEEAGGLG